MTTIEQETIAPIVAPVTTREVLHRAADLLEEFGWCQIVSAEDAAGCEVDPWSDQAVSFCALGAYARAQIDMGRWRGREFADEWQFEPELNRAGVSIDWNDEPGRTKQEVVARLREAAEAAA